MEEYIVEEFSKELLERSPLDDMYAEYGEYAPRKRFMHVDYKDEDGRDMHRSHVFYQLPDMDDEKIILCLMAMYEVRGCAVSAILEVDSDCRAMKAHYIRPGFLEECAQEVEKMLKGKGR